jgi:hypothetical protein
MWKLFHPKNWISVKMTSRLLLILLTKIVFCGKSHFRVKRKEKSTHGIRRKRSPALCVFISRKIHKNATFRRKIHTIPNRWTHLMDVAGNRPERRPTLHMSPEPKQTFQKSNLNRFTPNLSHIMYQFSRFSKVNSPTNPSTSSYTNEQ